MFGAWTDSSIPGDQVLLRTKYDLDTHEERYEYLTERVEEDVQPDEAVEVSAEFQVPGETGRYWGCFKVDREGEREFYCSFTYVCGNKADVVLSLRRRKVLLLRR
jgi:hypothetical protein